MPLRLPPPIQFPTAHLPRTKEFRYVGEEASYKDRLNLAHKRAELTAKAHGPQINDILTCSEKFWNMHIDPITTLDGAAVGLWTLQINLAGGTLAAFVPNRPDLATLWKKVLDFEVTIHFLLTELGHGLDARSIETVAEWIPGGGFDLHTPNDQAAKFMPASLPAGNLPRVAIVMAKLMVEGKDHGIRPFLVPFNDGQAMCSNITSRPLPTPLGNKPMGYSITSFNHVKLPQESLLGDLSPASDPRTHFLSEIWRIGIGSICLTSVVIPSLKVAAYVTAQYSRRRMITTPQGRMVPIISFRTQQAPILHALAQSVVLEAFFQDLRRHFTTRDAATLVQRNALSTIFKTIAIAHWRQSSMNLADRCGAQGLFAHNQIIALQMDIRGVTIAEGDILVLSIRLASELILDRYQVAPPSLPNSLLAKHEQGLLIHMRKTLAEFGGNHRSEAFNNRLLTRSVALVEAIGHRMAYEAAFSAGVDPLILRLYEADAILRDISWYSENGLATKEKTQKVEEEILTSLFPSLDQLLEHTGVEPYVFAAITTEDSWKKFVAALPVLRGNAFVDPLNPMASKTLIKARL
ncbi:acyl-CoA dehydrogenase NM domain-like protein [Gymnopilus junonius]|uniref:Acyl-CoA dehydrogenase NM domain-like protein n=1 Tax=Gymnopilus junonius TaxID=109634 RepID=A0A9P5NQA5_GYMJU|nr:acyl-CoA dehydrogenase NM domain-like protein [Gymnopilus junonius]